MNRGHEFPPYISRPTTYPRYGDDSNPYPSRQFGLDRRSSNRHGYGYGDWNPSSSLGNGELGLDNRSTIHRGYGDGNHVPSHRNRSFELDHYSPSFQDHNTRIWAPTEHRPFEERPTIRSFGQTSIFPMDHPPQSPRIQPQVMIIGNNWSNNGSRSPRFPFSSHRLTPRSLALPREIMNTHTPNHSEIIDNESKLTKEEQDQVLKKLKKEIYNPTPNYNKTMKLPPRKVSLYYRDLNRDLNYNVNKDHEEGKRCAICLEDFEAREEVILTPCNHMFHEECIVPWVKNHGQCPVCRSVFCERVRVNGSGLSRESGNRVMASPVDHGLFEGELLSLIRAVNEAFPWGD